MGSGNAPGAYTWHEGVGQHGSHMPAKSFTVASSLGLQLSYFILDTCQNMVSSDQYHVITSHVQFFFQVDLCPSTGFHLNCRLKPDFVAWTRLPSFQNFSLTSHFPLTQFFRCPISSKFPVTYHGVGVDIFQNRTFLWCACHIPLFFSQEIALQRWRRQSKLFSAPSFSVTFPRISMILWDMHFLVWHSFLSGAPLHFCSRHLNPSPFSKYDYRFSTLKHLLFSY